MFPLIGSLSSQSMRMHVDINIRLCRFQELPMLFLKGGAIVPTGPVIQYIGEANPTDAVTLLIALDDKGINLCCFDSDGLSIFSFLFALF